MALSGAIKLLVEKSVLGVGLPFCQLLVREALSPASHKSYCHCYWLDARTRTMLMTPLPLPQTWRNQTRTAMEVLSLSAYFCGTGRYYGDCLGLTATDSAAKLWSLWPIPAICQGRYADGCKAAFYRVQPPAFWLDLRLSLCRRGNTYLLL